MVAVPPRSDRMLTKADYQSAIDVQDACNLSGVARSFAELLPRVWAEAHEGSHGTAWVNEHPICVLYTNKMMDLAHADVPERYGAALDAAYRAVRHSAVDVSRNSA